LKRAEKRLIKALMHACKIIDELKVHKDIEKIMGHTLKKTKELLEKE